MKKKAVAPELETERLLLRAHCLSDFDACIRMWSNESVTRHTIGKPSTEQQTWVRILSYLGHWTLMGFGYWAIEEKKSKRYIGELGFADFKRVITPSIDGIPEMGWALSPKEQGKGYAREAISAALKWGDQNLNSDQSVCIINPENSRSIDLAQKFGFQFVYETSYLDRVVKMFERPKSKFTT